MNIINVSELEKTYITHERGVSFKETIKSLFNRKEISIQAVNKISFAVEQGELLGFLGPNGAGKSTTLKILTGVLYPTSGEANILGFTPWKQRIQYVSKIGAVFGQKSQLIWDIPAADSFEMNRAIYDIPSNHYKERLKKMVDLLEVGHVVNKPVRQISLGERMKCEFIMAMLHAPQIVFLDEPTIGLDVIAKERIRGFILEMNKNGATFILTTHDLDDVEQMAKRVIVINSGDIVYDDNISALKSYFGNKKLISITTERALGNFEAFQGVTIQSKTSSHSMEIELNTDILELNRFIAMINESYIINDMNISQAKIESVIKELYNKE
jgi:ABC-2 type transport system ATP-binding protein